MSNGLDPNRHTPDTVAPSDDIDHELAQLVAERAPRMFAIVFEHEAPKEHEIAAWGMDFDDGAYMIAPDGKTHFTLANVDNALFYIRPTAEATTHLIYTTAKPAPPDTND